MNRPSFTLSQAPLRKIILMVFLIIQLSCQLFGGILIDLSPGSGAPPSTLGPWTMTPFVADSRPFPADVTSVPYSAACPGEISFTATGAPFPVHHVRVDQGWNNWSHGYLGDVYYTSLAVLTINLPAGTNAFYFYTEGNIYSTFNLRATANDGTTTGLIPVTTPYGSQYVGFYTTGASCTLTSITITYPIEAGGFAVGEFGINLNVPHMGAMVCDDDIQVSLDESCLATIEPSMVLEGEEFPCGVPNYQIIVSDWNTGAVIDDHPAPWPQLGINRIGGTYKVLIIDPLSGNRCWSKVRVEDKQAPLLICPEPASPYCFQSISPDVLGTPLVIENCGTATLSYYDVIEKGSCVLGYEKRILRHWVAIDNSNNKGECIQIITVRLSDLIAVSIPPHYDGLVGNKPMLLCNDKFDSNKDISAHLVASPICVDGYLLDSAYYLLSGNRRPKVLGWNSISSGKYSGNPSPDPIFYPEHLNCWDNNTYIMWEGTGRPGNDACTNIASTFSDIKINLAKDNCDAGDVGCYKLLRTWTMVDWCTSNVREYSQIIKVMDTLGPQILYPDSIVVGTDIWQCNGKWAVPAPWIKDDCSRTISYSIRLSYGTLLGNQIDGYIATDLPLGWQEVWIVAEDCCGNVSEKKIIIDVQDDVAPNAVCEKRTVVSITGNLSPGENTAKIFAESFNDGSHDNCASHLYFKVIRMDELNGTLSGSNTASSSICNGANGDDDATRSGDQVYFDDFVKFCCADVGTTTRVVFRVFDTNPGSGPIPPAMMLPGGFLWGRFSDCMVEVEVQDKSIPTIVAPPDVVVSCMFWFDINNLSNPKDSTFGKIVNDIAWRSNVRTNDIVCENYCVAHPISGYPGYVSGLPPTQQPASNKACTFYNNLYNVSHPDNKYDLLWGTDGYILSPCGLDPLVNVEDMRACGVGKILRHFIARGAGGAFVRATQTIWVVDCDPFYISAVKCDTDDDIIWPNCDQASTLTGCGANTSPDNPALGRPKVVPGADDHCALLAINYEDEIFNIEADACYKILRKWTVIDWCNYDPIRSPNTGRWSYTQIIKVRDEVSPTVTCITGPCSPAVRNPVTARCMSHVEITALGADSCTPENWLFYEYKLDLFNDGVFEYRVGANTKLAHARGELPAFRNNPFADDETKGFDATGTYPIGKHRFQFYVEDGCGNITKCDTVITVKDCKAPTPYCLTGLITVPMPASGCVDIWAKDLNLGSYDNCTDVNNLKYYFNGDTSKKSIRVCCEDFVKNRIKDQYFLDVEMWVEDEEGNRDFCKTTIIIQDNGLCPDPTTFTKSNISGLIKTSDNKPIKNVDVDLYNQGALLLSNKTSSSGSYTFQNLKVNDDFIVKPVSKEDYLNGITTADIVKIQKHILGLEKITESYLLIAADVNKTGSITAADLADMRKLILGTSDKFAKSFSWIYIPTDFHFTDPTYPYNYPTEKVVKTEEEAMYSNFVGIKMGDINRSASLDFGTNLETRSNEKLNLAIDKSELVAGDHYTMNLFSDNFESITGMQFTLSFDPEVLEFTGINSAAIHLDESNLGLQQVSRGKISVSWNADQALSFDRNKILASLQFKVKQSSNVESVFNINSDITATEAYHDDLKAMDITLSTRSKETANTDKFVLYQNNPNPFKEETQIDFYLQNQMPITLSVYDIAGKVIFIKEMNGVKGINSIHINKSKFPSSGVYFYQLDSENHTDTKRMILLD